MANQGTIPDDSYLYYLEEDSLSVDGVDIQLDLTLREDEDLTN